MHAATADSASPSAEPDGSGYGASRPAVRRPKRTIASWRIAPAGRAGGAARRARCRPGRPGPRRSARSRCRAALTLCRRGDDADGVRAPGCHPGRQHDVRGPARAAPAPPRAQPGPGAVPQRHHPFRPRPHCRSRPDPHDGQASAPDARSADAASASAHSSTAAGLPDHGSTIPPGHPAPPGAVRVAGCQVRRRRATPIARISVNDTMSARAASGDAVTGTARPCSRCRRAPNRTPATRPRPARSPRMTPTRRYVLIEKVAEQLGGGLNADLAPVSSYPSRPSGTPRHGRSCCPASTTCRHSDAPAGHSPPLADFLNHRRISHLRRNSPASLPIQSAQKRTTCAGQDPGQAHPPDRSYSLGSGHWPMDALLSGLGLSPSVMVSADLPWVSRRLLGPSAGPASGSQPEPRRCLMATTTPSIALVPATPVFTTTERLALAGFLAGIAA